MRAKSLSASLIATLSLSGLGVAQDTPPAADTPKVKPGAVEAPAAGAESIDLLDPKAAAPIPPPDAPPNPDLDLSEGLEARVPESLKKMTDEEKAKLGGLLQDAVTYLGGIRIQEAFEKLVDAEAMAPDYAPVWNLKGAAYTKVRNFDKAGEAFGKAVELDPAAFMSRFNLTEIHFVQHKFPKADKEFANLIVANPKMLVATKALINFKIAICKLKQDDEPAAIAIIEKFDPLDDHPGFYFGNAALHFHRGEEDKAKSWMISAERIYGKNQINIYTDSFIEVGWIDNLQ